GGRSRLRARRVWARRSRSHCQCGIANEVASGAINFDGIVNAIRAEGAGRRPETRWALTSASKEVNAMREILDIPVGDLMSTTVVTVTPETSVEALTDLMTQHDYNGFPVVTDTGRLVGLVTRTDLFKVYLLAYRPFIPAIEDTWVSSVGAIMSTGVVA